MENNNTIRVCLKETNIAHQNMYEHLTLAHHIRKEQHMTMKKAYFFDCEGKHRLHLHTCIPKQTNIIT
jgi:hypothetical protein